MPSATMDGLVLRLRSLGESDLMLDVFTSSMGRMTALAKGGKRSKQRFFGVLLAGHLLEMNLEATKSPDLWRLGSARVRASHLGLRLDYRRLLAAGPVLELLLRATPLQAPQTGALELALATLARLEQGGDPTEMGSAVAIFLARLLDLLGYGLNLQACLHCGRPVEQMKSLRLTLGGGVVCPACPAGHREHSAPPGLVKFLAAARSMEPRSLARLRLPASQLPLALGFLADFWREVVGHDLPSLGLALRSLRGRSAAPAANSPRR
ncbi:MAG: DNA repair protein RecO [Proteobacteria bacterium]|nr:DNA repair protein RecO [Pseudomonadota bacterium]MBU1450014.1 DNA repair protein RecO [Pseudomonadota bacterium]MBU2470520.1 DNA repair protein RecO [Pseudomonadota bacterium]MBU2517313.1 DNA repair protein RecO [Pseudomonadota bacterium]